jgi:uncharacterized protein (DUF2252 family)
MNVREATESYERWLKRETRVVISALRAKHDAMRDNLYAFLRGTFYRWAQIWTAYVPEARGAPRVLAVGDLHVDSFGTWRDAEGRVAWGVDDFDNAYPLPYTNDLLRLATSAKIARDAELIDIKLADACDAILDGYASTLREGGCPMVFAEAHEHLEKLGIDVMRPPRGFWDKLRDLPTARAVPRSAMHALEALLSGPVTDPRVVHRRAGLGSLGQPRFALVAESNGGAIAREAKALIPSDCVWAAARTGRTQPYYARAMAHAVRARDPFQQVVGRWIVRRLSPDSNPIELATLGAKRDELRLLRAMGTEAANVHLGSPARVKAVLRDVHKREARWLHDGAKTLAKAVEREWRDYR